MSLPNNDFGFSVEQSKPFDIFQNLRAIALENNAERDILDLSTGDPGFAFAPGVRAREFASYLIFLDTKFNNTKRKFVDTQANQEKFLLEDIASWSRSTYVPVLAERYLKDMSEFIQRSLVIAKEHGFLWTPYDILKALFNRSMVSGGTYQDPQGELLSRIILTEWHKNTLDHEIGPEDLILTAGASQAIASLFKMLGQEGYQYLNPGDKVLLTSPGYLSSKSLLEKRGLEVICISLSPTTGEIEPRSLDLLKKVKGIKLMLIVNPNNPSGFALSEHTLKYLGHFAKEQGALIIADEVYGDFYEQAHSMMDIEPERTLRVRSCSKKACNRYLTEHLLKGLLPEKLDFKAAFLAAKAPGGVHGEFLDTCFVPGPSQALAIAHVLLEKETRQNYRENIIENSRLFADILGLPHENNRYYILFDLNSIEGSKKIELSIEQKIVELAKQGVILLPANLFFSKEDREALDRRQMVRACLANGESVKIKKAAKLIHAYLTS